MALRVDERRIWIVEIFVFGRPERFATERLEIPTEEGGVLVAREGLQDFAISKATGDVGDLAVALSIDADDLVLGQEFEQAVNGLADLVGGGSLDGDPDLMVLVCLVAWVGSDLDPGKGRVDIAEGMRHRALV